MRRECAEPATGSPCPERAAAGGTWTRPTASLERLRRYGKQVTVKLPFQPPFVILSDPDEIKELFTSPADAVHPGEGASILAPIVGRNSVILLDEQAHLSQRRLLLPAFHGERMKQLQGVMTELAEREISHGRREPVALHPRLQRVTLEIILRAVFGLDRGPSSTACVTCSPRCWPSPRAPCPCCPPCTGCCAGRPPSGASTRSCATPTSGSSG